MSQKRRKPREKLEDDIARAGCLVHQAMLDGKMKGWNPNHPAVKRLEALTKRKVESETRAICRLKTVDQDKLFEGWKFFRQKQNQRGLTRGESERFREIELHLLKHPHPKITRIEKQASDERDHIQRRVATTIKPPLLVRYSAYCSDNLGVPIDNLDKVAVTGRAYFIYDPNALPDIPCPVYRSPVVENPTWLRVAQLANDMIQTCELEEHTFLENVHLEKEIDGIKEMHFVMGS